MMQRILQNLKPWQVLVVSGMLIAAGIFAFVQRDFVREFFVEPIALGLFVIDTFIDSVSQSIWLALLVLGSGVLALRALSGAIAPPNDGSGLSATKPDPTRLGMWTNLIVNGAKSTYAAERSVTELRTVLLNALAIDYHVSPNEVTSMVSKGLIKLPPEPRSLLLEHHQWLTLCKIPNTLSDLLPEAFRNRLPSDNASTNPNHQVLLKRIESVIVYLSGDSATQKL
jgi:hypothetical protein